MVDRCRHGGEGAFAFGQLSGQIETNRVQGEQVMIRQRYVRIALLTAMALVAVALVSAVSLYADVQRIGCESGGQLLGPASTGGYSIADAAQPGACFVSFVSLRNRNTEIDRVVCVDNSSLASCQAFRKQVASGWSNFLGTRCTSVSFVGGARCTCTQTGQGCQLGDWPVESQP